MASRAIRRDELLPFEPLDAMIQGVGDVEVFVGIEGKRPRIGEFAGLCSRLPDDFHELIAGVENTDTAIPKFADVLETLSVYFYIIRITELAGIGSGCSVGAKKFSVRVEDLNPVIA